MGWFPCECCGGTETCTCMTVNDMPTITKSGWTGGNWQQVGDCCYRKTFTPSTEASWSCVATQPIQTFDWSVTCNTSFLTWNNHAQPLWFDRDDPNKPCPIPTELCCPNPVGPVTVGTTSSTFSYRGVVAFWLWYRPLKIEVYISRALVDCGSGTQVCKYAIVSKYFYTHKYALLLGEDHNWNRVANLSNSCFVKNNQYDTTSNGWIPASRPGFNMINPPDLSSMTWYNTCLNPPQVNLDSLSGGYFSFDRVKLYDALPIGTETFDNSNVSFSCPINFQEICQSSFSPSTQVCLYSPSEGLSTAPCWCTGTIEGLSNSTETLGNRCNYSFPEFGGFADQFVIYKCEQLMPNSPMVCTTDFDGCELAASPCATYTKHCITNSKYLSYSNIDSCNSTLGPINIILNGSTDKFDCSCTAISYIIPPQPSPTMQAFWYDGTICNPDSCNSGCCFEFHICQPCEETNPNKCFTKYVGLFRDITSRTITWNCSGVTQRSHCINAPSWTLTFA